jgi:hypothetical protein
MHNLSKYLCSIRFISYPSFCAFLLRLGAQEATVNTEEDQILFFYPTDDQRFDALGYQGNRLIHTPESDKLAASGTVFKRLGHYTHLRCK